MTNTARLTAAIPGITQHLGDGWSARVNRQSAHEVSYLFRHTTGVRFTLSVTNGADARVTARSVDPQLPDDVPEDALYLRDLATKQAGMAVSKLDTPRALAADLTRRILPSLTAAQEAQRAKVRTYLAIEGNRRQAAEHLAEVPGLSAPRRSDTHIVRTERQYHLAWDAAARPANGSREYVNLVPSIRAEVDAGEGAESVKVAMTGLSARAARAAIAAAIMTTEAEAVPRCTCARSWGLHAAGCRKYAPGHELIASAPQR